jgi:hypothetical protein
MNSENVIRGVYDSDNHDTACNLRALACALCVVFAALTFLLSPTQALAADEPHGQVLRVLLNAYHATVEESWFSGGGDPDPNDAILADLEACNDPEDYESFMTWYATQDGSEDSYMDLKYFADWDDHRALKAWNKYMLWLSEQMPAYDAQVYTQNYTRYIVSGSWVYDAGTSAISRLILPIEDNPYLYTV